MFWILLFFFKTWWYLSHPGIAFILSISHTTPLCCVKGYSVYDWCRWFRWIESEGAAGERVVLACLFSLYHVFTLSPILKYFHRQYFWIARHQRQYRRHWKGWNWRSNWYRVLTAALSNSLAVSHWRSAGNWFIILEDLIRFHASCIFQGSATINAIHEHGVLLGAYANSLTPVPEG